MNNRLCKCILNFNYQVNIIEILFPGYVWIKESKYNSGTFFRSILKRNLSASNYIKYRFYIRGLKNDCMWLNPIFRNFFIFSVGPYSFLDSWKRASVNIYPPVNFLLGKLFFWNEKGTPHTPPVGFSNNTDIFESTRPITNKTCSLMCCRVINSMSNLN